MARDPSDELMNMRVIYGSPPEQGVLVNFDKLGPCIHCGKLASEHCKSNALNSRAPVWCPGVDGEWLYTKFEAKPIEGSEKLVDEIEKAARKKFMVDAPPTHASSDELSAIRCLEILFEEEPVIAQTVFDALAKLDDVARARVLRYALSRWSKDVG